MAPDCGCTHAGNRFATGIGIALLLIYHPQHIAWRAILVTLVSWTVVIAWGALAHSDWLLAAIVQTTGVTSLKDLAIIGGWQYLKALPIFAVGVALVEFGRQKSWGKYLMYLWPIALVGGAAAHIAWSLLNQQYAGPMFAYGQLMWLAALQVPMCGMGKHPNYDSQADSSQSSRLQHQPQARGFNTSDLLPIRPFRSSSVPVSVGECNAGIGICP